MSKPFISIVAPCYNEEQVLPHFFTKIQEQLTNLDIVWEIICINDGSSDKTTKILDDRAQKDDRIKVIEFSRNFGKEAALTAGLDYAKGEAVIPIDVDLQDPPELIAPMIKKWQEGYDIVYGVRNIRHTDSFLKYHSANLFYRLFNRLSRIEIPPHAGDFRLMDMRVVNVIKQLPERNRFMKGIFSWAGFQQAVVNYERQSRIDGNSKFGFWKLWNFALDGLTSFTTAPLRIWLYVGIVIAGVSFIYALFLILRTLLYGIDIPGYASLMVAILFLGGVQLISLGIIGEYLGRTYNEVKNRPIYVVRKSQNLENKEI